MIKSFLTSKKAIIVPVILAGIGVFLLSQYLKTKEGELGLSAELLPIVVANTDIPAFTKLDRSMFVVSKVPRKFVQPAAFDSVKKIDRRVNLVPILKGGQIVETMLASRRQSAGLALKITKGHRAVSVGVTPVSAVSGLLQAGNTVDVLGTFKLEGKGEGSEKYRRYSTFTVLQNLTVLAVGQDMGMESFVSEAKQAKDSKDLAKRMDKLQKSRNTKKKGQRILTVTLLATPEQVQKLVLSQEVGKLTLALRSVVEGSGFFNILPLDGKSMLGIEDQIYMPRPWREVRGSERY